MGNLANGIDLTATLSPRQAHELDIALVLGAT
jgi:hypothetical protein